MSKKTRKAMALVLCAGTMLGMMGCLGDGFMKQVVWGVGTYLTMEYITDGGVIDWNAPNGEVAYNSIVDYLNTADAAGTGTQAWPR